MDDVARKLINKVKPSKRSRDEDSLDLDLNLGKLLDFNLDINKRSQQEQDLLDLEVNLGKLLNLDVDA